MTLLCNRSPVGSSMWGGQTFKNLKGFLLEASCLAWAAKSK